MKSFLLQQNNGNLLVLLAAVLWGTTGTAQAFASPGFNPLVIGSMRLCIAGLLLLLLAFSKNSLKDILCCRKLPLLLAALLTAGYQLCFFSAVAKTGVAVGTVVGIGSSPIIGGLLARLFRHESLRGRWFIAVFLAISGCSLLSLASGQHVRINIAGILLAIGAGACYAGMALVLKEALQYTNPIGVMAVVFCLAALLLLPVLIGNNLRWLWHPRSFCVVLHLGVVATAIPYILFAKGLQYTSVTTATILTLAEPMTAASLGILLLREPINLQIFCGIFLIFTGLGFLIFMEHHADNKTGRIDKIKRINL